MTLKTISSRTAYENHWMRVREDRVEWPDGNQGIYGVVEKPDFAVIMPFENGAFCLVDQYRYPIGQRTLEFPMGAFDHDHAAGHEEVARGELQEETGLKAGRLIDLGFAHASCGYATQGYHSYLALDLDHGRAAPSREEGDLKTRWFTVTELETKLLDGAITDAQSLAAYLKLKLSPHWSLIV